MSYNSHKLLTIEKIIILMIALSNSVASGSDNIIYMDLEPEIDSYNINLGACDNGVNSYQFDFKLKKNILTTAYKYYVIAKDDFSIETDSHSIDRGLATINNKSQL